MRRSNTVLAGVASRLQASNKSLQNQLYVQKDLQNVLNLLLGGVEELPERSPREEAVAFFKDVLQINHVSTKDFVKAYRKTEPREYEDKIKLDSGQTRRIWVKAPGIMFVRLQSEVLRDQAIAKARGLGGKRHDTDNYKYFVNSVECEATRATKEKVKHRIQKLVKGNKEGKNDKFYVRGTEFVVNGTLQKDFINTPTIEEINRSILQFSDSLDKLDMAQSTSPLMDEGNTFRAFLVRTKRMDILRLAYVKVFTLIPQARHVVMAYRVGKFQGSCDDEEFKAGHKLLRVLISKSLKNAAIFVSRETSGQQLGPKRFEHIIAVATSLIDATTAQERDDDIPMLDASWFPPSQSSQDSASSQQSET